MSGIVGIYHLNNTSVAVDDLHRMVNAIAHRGPDGTNVWFQNRVGLGHLMLWTTPESLLETLPLEKGRLFLTADARIDNRDELISTLDFKRRPVEKITDSDIILAAYERWGKRCPEKLIGDFSFAIWDQAQEKLFCARDHAGVKPFYYYHQPNECFVFASELKALLSLPFVPRVLNTVRVGDYLSSMMQDKASTIYEGIMRLPPACSLELAQHQLQVHCYWELNPHQEIQLDSNEAYAQAFRDIFTEAVRCRLRSAFPVGSHLSGGLDSSSVTCIAREVMSERCENPSYSPLNNSLHTVSIIFDEDASCDERSFINAVLEQGGVVPHFARGDYTGPLSDINEILACEDEAFFGINHFYPWLANRSAYESGLRVVLDGFDGDTTVSHGTSRLTELAQKGEWETLIQEAKAGAKLYGVLPYRLVKSHGLPYLHCALKQMNLLAFFNTVQLIHRHFGTSRWRLIVRYGIKPILRQMWKMGRKETMQASASAEEALINQEFARSTALPERIRSLKASEEVPTTLRQEHWLRLTHGIFPYTLEQIDRYAAKFSIEARHPFMDKRLIEFCLALPSAQKLDQGFGRIIMRRAMTNILPETVQWRMEKADFSENTDRGLLKRDRKLLDEIMSNKIETIKHYVDVDFVRAAYQRMLSAKGKSSPRDSSAVWRAAILTLWLEAKEL